MPLPCAGIIAQDLRIGRCPHKISKWCETMKKSDDPSAGKKVLTLQDKSSQVILFLIKNFTQHFTLLVERSLTIEIGMVHNGGKQEGKEGG